jgi:hypothetical protein
MKFLRLLLFVLTAGILFTSCQKELSAETGSALGTLAKDGAGNCAPIGINGAYKKDTALNAANFVDIQLDVTNVGIYIITTDTVNGYYFRATGVTPLPGANTIRLIGFGKPIAPGTDNFTVKFGGTFCEFDVPVTGTTGGGTTAVFTFPNAAACTGATFTNNFFAGVPTNPAINTITLLVNVTQAGTYNLSTTTVNNLTFTGTGSLSVGTNQPIVLGASGTPGTAGAINYTFSTTTPVASSCGFGINVQAAPTPATFTINCATPATQTGTFQAGTALTLASKITLSVTPTTTGSYTITTNTVNGVSFVGGGVFTTTATQNVDLFANPLNNTPGAAGPFIYTTTGGTAPCTNVSVTYTGAPTPATYTINCATAATQTGTFVAGTVLPATSKITLSVTPATTGSYTITTNVVNGVSYIGSGNFTTTATQNVDLFASPTNNIPTASGPFVYTTNGGTAPCTNVSVTYTGASANDYIRAKLNGSSTFTTFNINANGVFTTGTLVISGEADNTLTTPTIDLTLTSTGGTISNGQIFTQSNFTNLATGGYSNAAGTQFLASLLSGSITVTITNITTTPPLRVTGTFTASMDDSLSGGTAVIPFASGEFSVPYQ